MGCRWEGRTLSGKDEMQRTTEAPCLPETPYHVGRPLGGSGIETRSLKMALNSSFEKWTLLTHWHKIIHLYTGRVWGQIVMIRLKSEQVDTTFLIHLLSLLRLANKLRLSSIQNNWGSKESLSFEHCSVSTPKTHKFLYCKFKNHHNAPSFCV